MVAGGPTRDPLFSLEGKRALLTGATGFNQTLEIVNPRIARVGLRFNF